MAGQILRVVAKMIMGGLRGAEGACVLEREDLTLLVGGGESVSLVPYRALLARVMEDRSGVAAAVEGVFRPDLTRSWALERVARELKVSKAHPSA